MHRCKCSVVGFTFAIAACLAQQPPILPETPAYELGPEDSILISVLNLDEIGATPYAVDLRGNIDLPRLGAIHVAGLTLDQLKSELTNRYKEFLNEPVVTVSISEFHSQPVSILGAVASPGVHQIRGNRTLLEIISEAGGIRPDAGSNIVLARRMSNGPIPLKPESITTSGDFYIAKIDIRAIMDARHPQDNIDIKPNDVITVPKAEMIYVLGCVKKPGGYVLSEKPNLTVMEILSMAEGLDRNAGGKKAKILRPNADTRTRTEIPIDVALLMKGKGTDTPLFADDILFIPTSGAKVASNRAIETMVQIGTTMAIYAHPF